MKKLLATVLVLSSSLTMAACSSTDEGYRDQAPYAEERTAGGEQHAPAKAERVFQKKQMK